MIILRPDVFSTWLKVHYKSSIVLIVNYIELLNFDIIFYCFQVNFCESGPCQNGGVCTPLDAGHSCMCPEGYSGRNCEFFGFDCASNPCQNNGMCRSLEGGGYICDCPLGKFNALLT